MKHNYYAKYKNVLLRPLVHGDIENLRVWRNDAEATKFLRQVGTITPEMQENWFKKYLNDKDIITFAIEETSELKRMVGSVSLYNFRGDVAELGKIQIGDKEAHGKGIGRLTLVMALKVGFNLLHLSKVDGIVHQSNVAARTNDLKIGFQIVGEKLSEVGGKEDIIEINRNRLEEINSFLKDIEVYED
jgi:RimJ/RimL family protein N-acetyltransferase